MLKTLIILSIVHHAMPVEFFFARMRVLVEKNPSKNYYIRVEKLGDNYAKGNSTQDFSLLETCLNEETLDINHQVDNYVYGEDLKLSWNKNIRVGRFSQPNLMGFLSIKYQDKKYSDVKTKFDVCKSKPNSGADGLGSYIFEKIFIQGYHWFYGCVETKSVTINDKLYIKEAEMRDGIHCNTNATVRIDLKQVVDADCGVGGSGESFLYNTFRVIFNARFENCDGKKYDFLKGFNKGLVAALRVSMAKETIMELANNPIIR